MKTALIVLLGVAGCADILDIPDPVPASKVRCSGDIKVRMLNDLGGPTRDVGVPWFKASMDQVRKINEDGGILGCELKVKWADYGYNTENARNAYEGWKAEPDWDEVVAIWGWGSPDTVALGPDAAMDRKPFISGSYIASVASPAPLMHSELVPEATPTFTELSFEKKFESVGYAYNFFAGTDYSTGARIAMFFVAFQEGKKVGFFHCMASPYCTDPLSAARGYAKERQLQLGRELILELGGATVTQDQYDTAIRGYFDAELAQKAKDPDYTPVDWVWGGNTTLTTAMMAKSIATKVNAPVAMGGLGLNIRLIANTWGFGEDLFPLCGAACVEKVFGILPFVAYGDVRAPEMSKVIQLHDKYRAIDGDDPNLHKNVRYIQGYVNVMLFKKAAERVILSGKAMTGENIKAALETFRGEDTGGLTAGITFTPTDHRPQSSEAIYHFDAAGVLKADGDIRTIATKDEWLGW